MLEYMEDVNHLTSELVHNIKETIKFRENIELTEDEEDKIWDVIQIVLDTYCKYGIYKHHM